MSRPYTTAQINAHKDTESAFADKVLEVSSIQGDTWTEGIYFRLGDLLERTAYQERSLERLEMHLFNISDSLEKISNHMCLMETVWAANLQNNEWANDIDKLKELKVALEGFSSHLGGYATQPPLP